MASRRTAGASGRSDAEAATFTSVDAPIVTSVDTLNGMTETECVDALAPLFEGAPRFLARLCAARPVATWPDVFVTARSIAHAMPEDEKLELVNAHPRLGAAPGSVSPMSFLEQGYDRAGADEAADRERQLVEAELRRLNAAYEATFGFRYCTFVAGRSRLGLLADFEAALGEDRAAELARALDAVVDIARDRWQSRAAEDRTG